MISVSLQANKNYVKLYPNPVDNQLNLEIGSTYNSRVAWRVTSMSGASVIQGERLIAAGVNIWSIDVSKLAKGVYLFKMQGELIDKRIQFVKQ